MFPRLCEGTFKGKDKNCEVPQSSAGFRFIPVQVPAGVGILVAEASELLKFMVSAYLSAAATCYELVLVGAFVILMGAAVSELLYSVLFAALSAAALFCKGSIVGAFVSLVGAAASELLYYVWFAAFAAAALFFTVTIVGAFVIWVGAAATALLIAEICSALSAAAFCYMFAQVGAFVFLAFAVALHAFAEFVEVRQQAAAARGCHIAFWANSTPRVDVGDTPFQVRFVAWKLGQGWERGGVGKGER